MNTIKFINQDGKKGPQEILRIEAHDLSGIFIPRIGETVLTLDCLMGYTVVNIEYLYSSKKSWFGNYVHLSVVVYVKE
jgi:hypothetical protein